MGHYAGSTGVEVEIKDDASPVTKADRDAEAIILAALKALAPRIPVVSEETACDRGAPVGPRFFLVDPLDGTKEFIKKRTDFTVNIALIEEGHPRFGLVYAPARALLAVTVAPGEAVEATLPPDAAGADLGRLAQTRLHVRMPDPAGLTALARLAHVRAFAGYWAIPESEPTAVHGAWRRGPGLKLFGTLRASLGGLPIVAEDLGVITPEVEAIRHRFGFPGMAILQFAFGLLQRLLAAIHHGLFVDDLLLRTGQLAFKGFKTTAKIIDPAHRFLDGLELKIVGLLDFGVGLHRFSPHQLPTAIRPPRRPRLHRNRAQAACPCLNRASARP